MVTHVVNSMYSGSTKYPESLALNDVLQFNPTSTGRSGTIMTWVVPIAGKYKIEAMGASGGKSTSTSNTSLGGRGVIVTGTIALKQGDIVSILVGQEGGGYSSGGGGGGGSFVVKGNISSGSPLIIGGGGGGGSSSSSSTSYGRDGSTGTSGSSSNGNSSPSGGSNGGGGYSVPASSYRGGSGGGFYGDGQTVAYGSGSSVVSWETANGSNSYAQGGRSFLNGGTGGWATSSAKGADGGFGGGGGNGYHPGGGGGGYSGGAAGYTDGYGGGGGGSYVSGTNTSTIFPGTRGHGLVTIQLVQLDSLPPTVPANLKVTPSANSVYMTGETITVSWDASTDPEGDAITYDVDLYNGSAWIPVATKITDLSTEYVLPNGLNIATAKIRVRAVDNKTAASAYQESPVFAVRKQLLLIQDGDSMKTYSNGVWTSI
ncbi:fibronectin type III domain-containing protein [Bacillus mobilis]|uniref:fibronectin type III domain-containing protein n=1 Tax=Bacillus mobilis TaxID=2026190 RepID=UPI003675923C